MAALSAGAHLGDALVVPHLLDIAEKSTNKNRRMLAITQLGRMSTNPRIDVGLRKLLEDEDVDIRLAAFEAMLERRDPIIREAMVDDKFILNQIPCSHPLVYISQTGKPRIALFGEDISLSRPLTLHTWEGRLLMKANETDEKVQVFYRPEEGARAAIVLAPIDLPQFTRFLGHRTSIDDPSPGLDLGYGETISAIHVLWRKGYLECDFKAEQDRVLAAILANESEEDRLPRPEFDTPADPTSFQPARPGETPDEELAIPARSGLEGEGAARDTVPR